MITVKYRHCDREPDDGFRMPGGAREQVKLHNGFCLQLGLPCAYIADRDQSVEEPASEVTHG